MSPRRPASRWYPSGRSRVEPHLFVAGDKSIDWRECEITTCATCGLIGKAGDARHPLTTIPRPKRPAKAPPALSEDTRQLTNRMLGERDDD